MITNNINLNNLRVFVSVYKNLSMTKAAEELHLTQSGISQHMKSLEDALDIKLFDRIKQRLVPTEAAVQLYGRCFESLKSLEETLLDIKGREKFLSGVVRVGVPIEFGNNVIVPMVSDFAKDHPNVRFEFTYGFATAIGDDLLKGKIDFAFVDTYYGMDNNIATEPVYEEELILCSSPEYFKKVSGKKKKTERQYFESLEYVDYLSEGPMVRMWLDHHVGSKNLNINIRASAMDVQGIARLISSGLGVGILPGYILGNLQKQGLKYEQFKGSGKPLINVIRVAYLSQRSFSPAADMALAFLQSKFKKS